MQVVDSKHGLVIHGFSYRLKIHFQLLKNSMVNLATLVFVTNQQNISKVGFKVKEELCPFLLHRWKEDGKEKNIYRSQNLQFTNNTSKSPPYCSRNYLPLT